MPDRRELSFAKMDEIMPEVDRLIDRGYTTVGNWSLAQVCHHLSSSILWSMEGYPVAVPWIFRATLGKFFKKLILGSGKMRAGIKVPAAMIPKPDLDLRAEAESLRGAIQVYQSHPDQRVPNPMFGKLTSDEGDRLHCIHAAHHLSFVLPK